MGGRLMRVSTGFRALDRALADGTGYGMRSGRLYVVAACPFRGASAFAHGIVANAVLAKSPRASAIFSLDLSRNAVIRRIVAARARVPLHSLQRRFFRREKWWDLTHAAGQILEAPLYVDESPAISVEEVRSRCRKLAGELQQNGMSLGPVVLDYLQLMRGSLWRRNQSRQEAAEVLRGLKELAQELDVPVLALSRLNKTAERKIGQKPACADLPSSESIVALADVLILLHRDPYPLPPPRGTNEKVELLIHRNDRASADLVELRFSREFVLFEDHETFP
ncbi:DnaB-like helicase C-terminal domain-containing protein [Elusimicrobiota bacterium]